MNEVATAPAVLDTDVCIAYLFLKPFIDDLAATCFLIHVLDSLIVVGEISLMRFYAVDQTDYSHNLTITFGIAHYEWFGNLSGFQRSYRTCDFLRKLRHLEAGRACIVVYHHAVAVACIFVLRNIAGGFLECELMIVDNVGTDRIQTVHSRNKIFFSHFRTKKYMTGIYSVTTFFN